MAVWGGIGVNLIKNLKLILCLASKKVFTKILHRTERDKGFFCTTDLGMPCLFPLSADRGPGPKHGRLCTDGSNLCHLIKNH